MFSMRKSYTDDSQQSYQQKLKIHICIASYKYDVPRCFRICIDFYVNLVINSSK